MARSVTELNNTSTCSSRSNGLSVTSLGHMTSGCVCWNSFPENVSRTST